MIYTIHITAPATRHPGRSVFFAAANTEQALAITQSLGASLNAIYPTLLAGPRMAPRDTGKIKGTLDGLRGPDSFDPLLLADADYRKAYRNQRMALDGVHGLTPRECSEVLIF